MRTSNRLHFIEYGLNHGLENLWYAFYLEAVWTAENWYKRMTNRYIYIKHTYPKLSLAQDILIGVVFGVPLGVVLASLILGIDAQKWTEILGGLHL